MGAAADLRYVEEVEQAGPTSSYLCIFFILTVKSVLVGFPLL
jgi:hypothetical protein